MFYAIRTRINATTVVAGLALVFAMTGGAYAAKKYLITSTKQISPSVLKSLQGKAGPAGVNGAQGSGGSAGAQGPAGKDGAPGEKGAPGTNGKSVVAETENAGANCEEGGSSFHQEGSAVKTYACNGKEGAQGEPWPAGGTLPHEATETGAWSFGFEPPSICEFSSGCGLATISFPIPLAAELGSSNVHYVTGNSRPPIRFPRNARREESKAA